MLFSYNDLKTFLPVIIKGIINDKLTGERLEGVRVFVRHENRQYFTNANGGFIIQTINANGVLFVEKKGYCKRLIPISPDVYYIIQLEQKTSLTHAQNLKNF